MCRSGALETPGEEARSAYECSWLRKSSCGWRCRCPLSSNTRGHDIRKRVVERARIFQRMPNRARGGARRHRRRLPVEMEGNLRVKLLQAAKASLLEGV